MLLQYEDEPDGDLVPIAMAAGTNEKASWYA